MATSTITQKLSISTATASLIALFVGGTSQATTIDTTVGWTGGGYIFCSEPDCHYGQVFTVPTTENVLDSFSFFLSGSNPVIFYKAEIVPWDSNTFQSGSILYSSETRSNAGFPGYTGTLSGYYQVTFSPQGGLILSPTEQYVAYLKTEPGAGSAAIGNNFDTDSYSGGYHLFGSPNRGWYNANDTRDYAFQASFSTSRSVPEPTSTLGILAIGILGTASRFLSQLGTRK
jgi:hypothetical protein